MQKCYAAYKQGPCKNGEFLVLDVKRNAHCVQNECHGNTVMYNGQCQSLDGEKGCEEYKKIADNRKVFLTVNPTTLELACIDETENFVCNNGRCQKKDGTVLPYPESTL